MNFILKINESDSPKAAYIGWTPVKCTLTIEGYSEKTPMPVIITTGHDNLEGRISLYNDNSTSAEPIEKIEYDFQSKNEISFYVAGKYPHASIGKQDTFLKIESKNNEVPALTSPIMVRVRKNANELKPDEIESFLSSFVELSQKAPRQTYPGSEYTQKPNTLLDEIVLMHTYDAMQEIHQRTSFHPWHRAFSGHLERELQEVDPTVTIPYWRFDKKAENVFTESFIGKTEKSSDTTGPSAPIFIKSNPLFTYHTVWGDLLRGYWENDPANAKPYSVIAEQSAILSSVMVTNPYREGLNISSEKFKGWAYYEETTSHNQAHNAFTGHVSDPGKDPVDPLFFMMHGNVDRLWALWQRKYNRLSPTDLDTYPFQGKGPDHTGPSRPPRNQDKGNFLKDTLWPWDLDHKPIRPSRTWNAPNTGEGFVPQINLKFPGSRVTNAPGLSPTLESMIDYQGRLNVGITLGYDYDTIPYFDHDSIDFEDQSLIAFKANNKAFLDLALPVKERLSAASNARLREEHESNSLISIITDKTEDEQIRIQSVRLADNTTEEFLDTGIAVLRDDSEPVALRSELIHAVANAKRSNLYFPSRQPAFFNVLRGLMKSDHALLRSQSIEILSANEDEAVQDFLVEELKKDQSAFVSKKDAIAFLAQNTKSPHTKLLSQILGEDNDEDVKAAAVKAMGNDPGAFDLLKNIVMSDESFKIREAGALALHRVDRDAMNDLAVQIITSPGENVRKTLQVGLITDEVNFKAGLLNMLTFTGDISQLKQNESLKNSLRPDINSENDNKVNFISSFKAISDDAAEDSAMMNLMASKLLQKISD